MSACSTARISLSIGVVAALVNMVIGVLYGGIAGYFGGKVDNVMMRIVDIIIALPSLLYTILLMMLMGSNVRSILIALCLSSWVGTARITRSQVVSLKHQEYALAAKLAGASDFRFCCAICSPNAMGPIIVSVMFLIPGAIFSEAFLSFLGIGIQKPMASWGSLANDAIGTLTSAPYQMFFPHRRHQPDDVLAEFHRRRPARCARSETEKNRTLGLCPKPRSGTEFPTPSSSRFAACREA